FRSNTIQGGIGIGCGIGILFFDSAHYFVSNCQPGLEYYYRWNVTFTKIQLYERIQGENT
ncbi:MAG: hypothetical protein ACR2MT_18070, partial [Aurantibacter sp.]